MQIDDQKYFGSIPTIGIRKKNSENLFPILVPLSNDPIKAWLKLTQEVAAINIFESRSHRVLFSSGMCTVITYFTLFYI